MRRAIFSGNRSTLFGVAALCLVAQFAWTGPASAGVTPISGLSPYSDGGDPNDPNAVTECNGGPQLGVLYRNSETEPYIAVNPINHDNMIASWHQDRWSNGSAQGAGAAYTADGGATWTHVNIPFTRCSGGAPGSTGDYERASDPWISFGPDGAAYYMALVSDRSTSRNGMVVAKSVDGGAGWTNPIIIKDHDARGPRSRSLFHDKNSLTADPYDPNFVYATWTLFRNGTLALLFSRSIDGGMTWEAARPVNKFERVDRHEGVAFRQGSQIVVLSDGTLLNTFYRGLFDPRGGGSFVALDQAIFRSRDRGKHWERLDTPVSQMVPTGALDFELGIFVRDAGQIPDIAVDRNNGNVYIVWQDGRFSPFGASSIVISRSTDGGDTWSNPVPTHDVSNPFHQNFLPAVSVAVDGTVGVLFYDFRFDTPGDLTLDTDVHLAMLDPDLNLIGEQRLTNASFDMRQMVITGFRGYFPGDYVGLDAAGNDFVAAFTIANNLGLPVEFPQDNSSLKVDSHNRQDIVFTRVARGSSASASASGSNGSGKRGIGEPAGRLLAGGSEGEGTPRVSALLGAFPNPFNPYTTIRFDLATRTSVRLEVYDVNGRRVRTLVGGESYNEGRHHVLWDGRNDSGNPTASGVYFYRLATDGFVATKRMTLVK
jgi:hypothetical protein